MMGRSEPSESAAEIAVLFGLLRADDRTPEGLRAGEEALAFLKEISTHPTWGDQMRRPIAEDAAMYGLDHPVS